MSHQVDLWTLQEVSGVNGIPDLSPPRELFYILLCGRIKSQSRAGGRRRLRVSSQRGKTLEISAIEPKQLIDR